MISSIYSTTFSAASPAMRKGIAGLVTGINTEEMIQQMTLGMRVRIAQVQQRQTLVGWRGEAFQSVTSSLLDFRNKFMNSASATNMRNANFFQSAIITAQGKNASAVSITGSSSSALSNFSISKIESLATTASFTK
jgi:flagellar hook-associated protein 2